MFNAYKINEKGISLETDIVSENLSIDMAVPCGLVINEILTNCVKHAFPNNQKGRILIQFKKKNDGLQLIIKDNGVGLSEEINIDELKSLGMQLIHGIVTHQLCGEVTMNNKEGLEYIITFNNRC